MDPMGMKFSNQPIKGSPPWLRRKHVDTLGWSKSRRSCHQHEILIGDPPQITQDETLPSRKFAYPTKRENDKNQYVCKSAGYQGIC